MQKDKYLPPEAPPAYGLTSATQVQPEQNYPPPGYQPQGHPSQGYPTECDPPPSYEATSTFQQLQVMLRSVVEVPPGNCFSLYRKNKPQFKAMSSASFIFFSGGLNIAWSAGFQGPTFYDMNTHLRVAWFIGGIIGALVSGFLANKISQKFLMVFSSILVIIGGILLASTHHNPQAITAALYLDGVANGLVFAQFMGLAGELAVPYRRGMISACAEQLSFSIGIFLQILYTRIWNYKGSSYHQYEFSPENLKGVLSAFFGLMALITGLLHCIESPVSLLAKGEEEQAIDALRRLQQPHILTTETYDQLAEHKRYLAQNKDMPASQSVRQALPAFLCLSYLRVLNAMTMSSFMKMSLTHAIVFSSSDDNNMGWYIGFGIARLIGSLITTFCMESTGRKILMLLGLFFCNSSAFMMGGQFNILLQEAGIAPMLIGFQFLAGLALTATSPYLTEAYPLHIKPQFIGLTFVVEMLIFITITLCDSSFDGGKDYFYALGFMFFFSCILVMRYLPEADRTSLREALDEFTEIYNDNMFKEYRRYNAYTREYEPERFPLRTVH